MKSKQSQEGYLMINHRDSPGIDDEVAVQAGLPPGAGRGMFESAVISCSHCQAMVIVNPLRTRERHYCPGCDHYVCDICHDIRVNTGICKTFQERAEEMVESEIRKTLIKEI